MQVVMKTFFVILLLWTLNCGGHPFPLSTTMISAPVESPRIRYDVAALEVKGGQRTLLSETTIEGPAGTDFQITLQSSQFQMSAHFLNDLAASKVLSMRADLKMRRLYGRSERNLPLYEEDGQKENLQVGFDEKVVLLPFGGDERDPNSEQLKIEITPALSDLSARLPSGEARPLEIKILKDSPGNSIRVEAMRSPHRFTVDAVLLEDGNEVARGMAPDALLEQPREILLQPNKQASDAVASQPLAVSLTVDQYLQRRRSDQAFISFDVYRPADDRGNARETLASQWAGSGPIDSPITYDISNQYLNGSGRKYELKLIVKLAPGETAD